MALKLPIQADAWHSLFSLTFILSIFHLSRNTSICFNWDLEPSLSRKMLNNNRLFTLKSNSISFVSLCTSAIKVLCGYVLKIIRFGRS